MITILKIRWLNLSRDYAAVALTFVLPLIFFSVFAFMFAGPPVGSQRISVLIVDQDQTPLSRRLVQLLTEHDATEVVSSGKGEEDRSLSAEEAGQQVRGGEADAAIVIPKGWSGSLQDEATSPPAIQLIYDQANPTAAPTLTGLVQTSALQAAPDLLLTRGIRWLEQLPGGELTPKQQEALDDVLPFLRGERPWSEWEGSPIDFGGFGEPSGAQDGASQPSGGPAGWIPVEPQSSRGAVITDAGWNQESSVSYYAAGLGVMFLLFSMTGAGAALLDEQETGTLERFLTSGASMGDLLLGNWMFFSILGIAQVTLMFFWGGLVFGLDLWSAKRLAGFFAMTLVTGVAAAAFGMFMATLCKTRAQLNSISTITILLMSAAGGSMMPRFLMPPFMNQVALLTFNGWALDGYLKVFWYDDPSASIAAGLAALVPQLAVLGCATVVLLFVARLMARRWETV